MGFLLSLLNLAPANGQAKHLGDGVGSNGGKAICHRADGEIPNSLFHIGRPNIVGLFLDGDVRVLVEYLVDRDEVLIVV